MSHSISNLLSIAGLAAVVASLPVAQAQAADGDPVWNITAHNVGEVTAFNGRDGTARATYILQGGNEVFETQKWTFGAVAEETRQYKYAWDYSGFHSFFQVYAELDAFGGAAGAGSALYAPPIEDCCTSPSDGFATKGVYDFGVVQAGESFGFTMLGRNYDGTRLLKGQLSIAAVPEPDTMALAAVGLLIAGLQGRRLSRRREQPGN